IVVDRRAVSAGGRREPVRGGLTRLEGRGADTSARSSAVAVRAVRGAVQLERDEAGHMDEQVGALLTAVLERNGLSADDLISIWFTATPDLHSDFPAAAARKLGIVDVPLICAQELDIEGAMPRVVRILAHIESDRPRADIAHVYLGAAA